MKKLKKDITIAFIIALIFSIMLVAGVPGIIMTAMHKHNFIAIPIVCLVLGFYGTPLLWIWYANLMSYKSLLELIINEKIYDVNEIAQLINSTNTKAHSSVLALIKKGYLSGYKLINNTITINENKRQVLLYKCPNCGAQLEENNNKRYCPYCKSKF